VAEPELASQDAQRIRNSKKALGQPCEPHDDGFEFSGEQLSDLTAAHYWLMCLSELHQLNW